MKITFCPENNFCSVLQPYLRILVGSVVMLSTRTSLNARNIRLTYIPSDYFGGDGLASCWKCGAELAEGAKYCHNCGSPVRTVRKEEFSVSSDDLIEKVRQVIHEGNVTRIVVKDEKGKTLLEIPATVGLVGAILVPWLAALGAIAALATRCTLVVERVE